MANLKHDLDEYLLLQSDQKKTNFKIDMKMPSLKVPEIKNLFGKSQPQEVNGWLEETKESCCPKLVCLCVCVCVQNANMVHSRPFKYVLCISVATPADIWIFDMSGHGHFLYVAVHTVPAGTHFEGQKIRTFILAGQFILHYEVSDLHRITYSRIE